MGKISRVFSKNRFYKTSQRRDIMKISNDITTWRELKELIDSKTETTQKGNFFEYITKCYLIIEPLYQTKLKNVWLLKEDEYWAIQCKYRSDETSSIVRDDIATFLDISNNICKNISHKLVCSTAYFSSSFDNWLQFNFKALILRNLFISTR